MSTPAKTKRKHAGRKRDLFPIVCIVIACVPLLFIGSAILTIIAGGITHVGDAVTSEEVLFSLRMSMMTSTISTTLCLFLALPTAYALTRTNMPFKRAAETLADRVGIILDGRLRCVVASSELFDEAHAPEVKRFLGMRDASVA